MNYPCDSCETCALCFRNGCIGYSDEPPTDPNAAMNWADMLGIIVGAAVIAAIVLAALKFGHIASVFLAVAS